MCTPAKKREGFENIKIEKIADTERAFITGKKAGNTKWDYYVKDHFGNLRLILLCLHIYDINETHAQYSAVEHAKERLEYEDFLALQG